MKFSDFVFKTNIIGLRSYLKNALDSNKARINDVIKLYEERKIRNIKTALNTIESLASNNKNTISSGKPLRLYNNVIEKYSNALPMTRRRERVRQEPQQSEPTQGPPPEEPIIVDDVDKLEVKQHTNANRGLFCIDSDSDTDSTRDEPTYEYVPYTQEKRVIKYSIDFDDEFNDDMWTTFPPTDNTNEDIKEPSINNDELKTEDNQQILDVIIDPKEKLKQLISIEEQPSILHDIELIEIPNTETIEKILISDLLQQVKHDSGIYDNERHHLESYKSLIDINNQVKVKYHKKDKYNHLGRTYCEKHLGAIALRREIRGSIFGDRYTDIDISNCHPSIFLQLAQMYDIECPELTKYVMNRKQVLNDVMNYYNVKRDQAKQLFIILLYGGSFRSWKNKHKIKQTILPSIAQMKKEFSSIKDKIIHNNQHIRTIIKNKLIELEKNDSDHKVDNATVAYYMQEIENRILEQVYLYCVDKNVIKDKICSLCYDGIMILKENYYPELRNELNKLILTKFGLDLIFEQKDMESYLDILDDHIKTNNEIKIESRYLLDEDKLLDDDTILVKSIESFFNEPEIKSLNIKSPYDTGKTQLIKQILTKYNPNRVLWVSYRLTLSYDVFSNFEPFNFQIYTNNDFEADRLIIQAESLLRLITSKTKLKKYDLIVIDEVESILRQFNSHTTFRGKAPRTFDFLIGLLKHPETKMITLDGDLDNRTYDFINGLGKSINIHNTTKFNTKTINIMNVKETFVNKIFNDLDLNLKLIMPTMSATIGADMYDKLRKKYPNKNILYYSGLTSDEDKLDITKILEKWGQADVVIYSPTIEAGVSFDSVHFDRLYGFMCNSCTVLSYFQMMARVRKFKYNDFYIFTELKYNPIARLWTYDEIDQQCSYRQDQLLENEYIYDSDSNIIINRKNGLFRKIVIHNMLEQRNNNNSTIIKLFYEIGTKKGYTINLDYQEKPKNEKTINVKYVDISNSSDIDDSKYNELLEKQKQNKATKTDKLKIEKFIIKNMLGLDIVDEVIVKHYYKHDHILKNFTALIDPLNIRDKDEIVRLQRAEKTELIKTIINYMGFDSENIFNNDKKLYKSDIFNNLINNTITYIIDQKDNNNFNYLVNHSKQDIKYLLNKDLSAKLRYINTIINSYGITIGRYRKGTDKQIYQETGKSNKNDFFKLEIKKDTNEIISNKITYRNFKLNDSKKIYKIVKPDIFEEYITRKPYNELDTKNLDVFTD